MDVDLARLITQIEEEIASLEQSIKSQQHEANIALGLISRLDDELAVKRAILEKLKTSSAD